MSTNCECYRKLQLAAVMAAIVATTLVATMLVAIQWQHEALYISSFVGSLGSQLCLDYILGPFDVCYDFLGKSWQIVDCFYLEISSKASTRHFKAKLIESFRNKKIVCCFELASLSKGYFSILSIQIYLVNYQKAVGDA